MSSQIRVHDLVVGENDAFVDLVFTLSAPSDVATSVDWATTNGTAVAANNAGYDFFAAHGTVSFAAGETVKTVRIQLFDGITAEPLQSFGIALSNATGATLASTDVLVTVVDNDAAPGIPEISVRDAVVDEKAGTAGFSVVLDRPAEGQVSVGYATRDGNALAGSDYASTSGTLVFEPGETTASVTVTITDDAATEGDELFELALSNSADATLADATATARIVASDATATASPFIRVADVLVGESQGFAELVFTLSAPSALPVSVNWATGSGSALPASSSGWDFSGNSGTLSFAPGQTVQTVRIDLLGDSAAEPRQSFPVLLTNALGGTLAQSRALVTLADDDAAAGLPRVMVSDTVVDERAGVVSFAVSLDRPSPEAFEINWQSRDVSAVSGEDYLGNSGRLYFAPGQTTQTVTLALIDDTKAEQAETLHLVLDALFDTGTQTVTASALIGASDRSTSSSPALRVSDVVVGEGQGYAELVFTLSAPATQPVSVNWATTNGTAVAANNTGYDFFAATGAVTFAPGETTRTLRIDLADDAAVEPAQSFAISLSNATGATLASTRALVTVLDDDAAPGTPQVTVSGTTVDERAGFATFVVALDRPAAEPLNLFWYTAGGNATAGTDYMPADGWIGFGTGEISRMVRVALRDDATAEGAESFDLVVGTDNSPSGVLDRGIAVIGASDGTASNAPVLNVADVVVGENDGVAEVVFTLSAPATQRVTANWATQAGSAVVASGAGYDFFGASGTVAFAAGETTQTVRIDLLDDNAVEALQSFGVRLSAVTGATAGRSQGLVTIVDDDGEPGVPGLSVADVVVDERAGVARFVVTLDRPADDPVSVRWATVMPSGANGFATAGEDYVDRFGTLHFAPGETAKTVSIVISDDTSIEGPELFEMRLVDPVNATLVDAAATALIGASDGPTSGAPRIRVADVVAGESDGTAELVFTLSAPSTQTVTFNWSTGSGSAVAANNTGYDFFATNGTVSFAPGQTTQTARISLADDLVAEARQSFPVALSGASGGILERTSALVTLIDDDATAGRPFVSTGDATVDEHAGVARFVVTLDRPATAAVSVDFTTAANGVWAGSATSGSDFTPRQGTLGFAPGETVKTVVVPVSSDGIPEGAELFDLVLSNANGATLADATGTAVIGANDGTVEAMPLVRIADTVAAEGDGVVDLVFSLSAPSTQAASVRWASTPAPPCSRSVRPP